MILTILTIWFLLATVTVSFSTFRLAFHAQAEWPAPTPKMTICLKRNIAWIFESLRLTNNIAVQTFVSSYEVMLCNHYTACRCKDLIWDETTLDFWSVSECSAVPVPAVSYCKWWLKIMKKKFWLLYSFQRKMEKQMFSVLKHHLFQVGLLTFLKVTIISSHVRYTK